MISENWVLKVTQPNDKLIANKKSQIIAKQVGFKNTEDIEKILITVNELSSNLIKYTMGGEIILSSLNENGKRGIQIESIDNGPGIEDIELAMVDGYSTINSLGYGLGTVNRLMDEFKIESRKNIGTHIIAKRWIMDRIKREIYPLDFGGASRPFPGLNINGDAFIIKRWGENVLISIIDGLGHGPMANHASNVALQYIQKNYDQPINQIIRGLHVVCKHTRGVVAALARFNLQNRDISFCGVGNIEARIFGNQMMNSFISRRGIIGRTIPTINVIKHPWEPGFILVLFSDGIKSRWGWKDFSHLSKKSARFISFQMLESLARDNDDATIVIVKEFEN